jgi:putative transposase
MSKELLEPGCYYHIYNHAVGNEKLFLSEDNYFYFLRRYQKFICPVAETYAYCLMANHVHFLVEIKDEIGVTPHSKYSPSQFISKQFSNLFSSYAQAFNKQQARRGNLFISNFKRIKIDSDEYLTNIIRYVHMNPLNHSYRKHPSQWKFSSYNELCSGCTTFLSRDKVLKWYGGLTQFQEAHAVSQLPESFKLSGS